jgi:hypothetical protein
MWMGGPGAGPGVEDAQDAHQAAHLVRLHGEFAEGWGRGAPQPVVQGFVVAADEVVALLGQRPDHMTGGPGPQCLPPLCPPHRGVLMVALGTPPMAAGVVGIGLLPAGITRQQRATHDLGPAVHTIIQRTAMTGPELRAKPLLRGGTLGPEDVRHRWHARAPTRVEVGHEGMDGRLHDVEGVGRQRRVGRGGTGTLVAQECWDNTPRHTPR